MKDLQNTKLINLKGTQGFKGKQGPVVEQHPKSDHSNFSRNSRSITKEILYLPQLGLTREDLESQVTHPHIEVLTTRTPPRPHRPENCENLSGVYALKVFVRGNPEEVHGLCYHGTGDALSGRNSGKGNIKTSCLDLRKLAMWRKSSLSSYCFSKSVNKKTKFLFKIRNVLSYLQSSSVDEALVESINKKRLLGRVTSMTAANSVVLRHKVKPSGVTMEQSSRIKLMNDVLFAKKDSRREYCIARNFPQQMCCRKKE
ncbi:hypothetical protein Tco_1403951 [Tanacetum coccineum]